MIKNIFIALIVFTTIVSAQHTIGADTMLSNVPNQPNNFNLHKIKPANNINPLRTEIDYKILGGVALSLSAAVYSINDYYQHTWWRDQRTGFKFVNDWQYALWIDKLGHLFGTYLQAHAFSSALEAANMNLESATLIGAGLALGMQLYVEIQDGYGPKWGFSPGDAVSDLLGATYYVAKYYFPFLNNIQPRVSYFPSEEMLNGTKPDMNISDDYEGQKLWLSFRMKNLLPEDISNYWPSWLMLSVGYSVSQLNGSGGGIKKFYVGFDFDAEEIPLHGRFWNFVKNTLNYIHFPMPGIRFSPDAAFLVFAY